MCAGKMFCVTVSSAYLQNNYCLSVALGYNILLH